MLRNKTLLFFAILWFNSNILHGQVPETDIQKNYFKIGGQYRARPEYRRGYKVLAADSSKGAFFIAQRARLILDYRKDKVACYASIQDSRTWGDEEQKKDIGGLQANELWFEWALLKGLSVKMGRQELAYDDHRILGNLDWGNLTISHDALLVKFNNDNKGFKWHLGGAYNQSGEPLYEKRYTLKNYKYLGFTWLKKDLPKTHSTLSAMAVLNGMASADSLSNRTLASITSGLIYNYKHEAWKAVMGVYYQAGKTSSNLDISAYMLNMYAEYRKNKVFTALGADVLSGDSDNTPANKSENFSTLYATNHKFYGYMDYFLDIPTDTKQRGLMDFYWRVGFTPHKNMAVSLDTHAFSLAQNRNNTAEKTGKYLGTEFDLLFDYRSSDMVSLQAGYSMMFATESMELLKGGNAGTYNGWAYVMVKVSPTLFIHEFIN